MVSIEDPRRAAPAASEPAGGLDAVEPGIRTSISTTSGAARAATRDRLGAVGGLADDLDVRLGVEDHAGSRPAPAPGRRRSGRGSRHATGAAAAAARPRSRRSRRAGVELAAEQRDPLAHARQAVAAAPVAGAGGRRGRRRATSSSTASVA